MASYENSENLFHMVIFILCDTICIINQQKNASKKYFIKFESVLCS